MRIAGFNRYDVSPTGVVTSYMRWPSGQRLKPINNNRGAQCVVLYDDTGRRHHCFISRIVATHFIPNPDNLPNVVHLDGNIKNNAVDNLQWQDTMQTHMTAVANDALPQYKITTSIAKRIRLLHSKGVRISELAKIYEVNRATIRYWLDKA